MMLRGTQQLHHGGLWGHQTRRQKNIFTQRALHQRQTDCFSFESKSKSSETLVLWCDDTERLLCFRKKGRRDLQHQQVPMVEGVSCCAAVPRPQEQKALCNMKTRNSQRTCSNVAQKQHTAHKQRPRDSSYLMSHFGLFLC